MSAPSVTASKRRQDSSIEWERRREDEARVLRKLEELCDREQPGKRIPTHTELMRQFNASERAVLRALDELKRRGRVIRRHGSGTYVGHHDGMLPIGSAAPEAASKTLVVIAKPDHGFFDDCMSQLYSNADSHEYEIIYQLLRSQHNALTDLRPVLGSAAGFILFSYSLAPLARALAKAGNRVVIVGSPNVGETPDVPVVCTDHEAGGYLAVKHLLDLGHRRIGFPINRASEMLSPRWTGVRRALEEGRRSGLNVAQIMIEHPVVEQWEQDPTIAGEALRGPDAPTALVAWNDYVAENLLRLLRRAKIRVPEEISLIGYDNSSIASRLTPALTTIDSGVSQLLSTAIRTLLTQTGVTPMTQMTIPSLVIRESVSEPRI
jgi:DNA-binding LacI/PurR family transcriptional regulator